MLMQYPLFATSTCFSVLLVAACTTMAIFSGLVCTYYPDPYNDGLITSVPEDEKLYGEVDTRSVSNTGNGDCDGDCNCDCNCDGDCSRGRSTQCLLILSILLNCTVFNHPLTHPITPPYHPPSHTPSHTPYHTTLSHTLPLHSAKEDGPRCLSQATHPHPHPALHGRCS